MKRRRRAAASASGLNFYGNVEGDDIYKGTTDVVVCDGFVGNVALKTSEGLVAMLDDFLQGRIHAQSADASSPRSSPIRCCSAFKRRVDPRRYNGATLLGLRGSWSRATAAPTRSRSRTRCARRTPKRRTACSSASRSASPRCRRVAPARAAAPIGCRDAPPMHSRIAGTGSYLPAQVLTNDDLAQRVDTSDEWIRTRTGIRAAPHRRPTTRRRPISRCTRRAQALAAAGIAPADVDLIIVATTTPDMVFPSTACILQAKLGATRRRRRSTCRRCARGFVYALAIADRMIASGMARNALVVGAEIYSRILDWNDRGTCVLFGDGAGAVVLRAVATRRASCRRTCTPTAAIATSCACPGRCATARSPARRSCTWTAARCSSSR